MSGMRLCSVMGRFIRCRMCFCVILYRLYDCGALITQSHGVATRNPRHRNNFELSVHHLTESRCGKYGVLFCLTDANVALSTGRHVICKAFLELFLSCVRYSVHYISYE